MRKRLIAVLVFGAAVSATAEELDILTPFYGNTWVYNANDGTKYVEIKRDHTIRLLHYDGILYNGRWSREGGSVCFHIGEDTSCFTDLKGREIGQPWVGAKPDKTYTGIIRQGTLGDMVQCTDT